MAIDDKSVLIGAALGIGLFAGGRFLYDATNQDAYYKGRKVEVISERCDNFSPHQCLTKIKLPNGQEVEVNPDALEYK